MAELQRACEGLVRAAQVQLKSGGRQVKSDGTTSLLSLLIEATDAEGEAASSTANKLSDRELIDNTLTFLLAGVSYVAAILCSAFLYTLAFYPWWRRP